MEKDKIHSTSKKYDNLVRVIIEYLSGKYYTPIGKKALCKKLGFEGDSLILANEIIQDLIQEDVIEMVKKKLHLKNAPKSPEEFLTGKISIHPRGFGFVTPEKGSPYKQDIFIPTPFTNDAVEGDIVKVWINPKSNWKKGPDGEVVSIEKRTKTHLAGTVRKINKKEKIAYLYVPILGQEREVLIKKDVEKIKVGDRLRVEISKWNDPIIGHIVEKIGHMNDASSDIPAAIAEYDIASAFSKDLIKQANALGKQVKQKDQKERRDLTQLICFTIDPKTARDFDDALSLEMTREGNYQLGVHIADVAHYIKANSPLDIEARQRGNSVYFPGKCIPMIPENLSNGLCSLKPDVVRLTMSVFMTFNAKGDLLNYSIERTFIRSKKRFTYEEAKQIIDSKKDPFKQLLTSMVQLCLLLKKKRNERGSVDLALPQIALDIDKKGNPTGYHISEYDISHQLVEEFMLKANEIVATHLTKKGKGAIFRVHEIPAEEDIQGFFSLARILGFHLPQKPSSEDIQKLFHLAKETPFAHQLAVSFIRSMKLANYSHENVGHYGLALEHYCHFTSPIRRYTDLVTGRLLFNEEGKDLDMQEIAKHCSERERIAFRAESSVNQLKKLRFLDQRPTEVWEAMIASIKPFGLFFTLIPLEVEGFIHISELGKDFYLFNSKAEILTGEKTGETFRAGQMIFVKLVSIQFITGEVQWKIVKKTKK